MGFQSQRYLGILSRVHHSVVRRNIGLLPGIHQRGTQRAKGLYKDLWRR